MDENPLSFKESDHLSKDEFRSFLFHLGYLTDYNHLRATGKLNIPLMMSQNGSAIEGKMQKLDTYQFEDLFQIILSKRYFVAGERGVTASLSPRKRKEENEFISVHSAKCYVLGMNDICRDW